MNEQAILQEILQDMKIGWWVADITHETIRISDTLRDMAGLASSQIGFETLQEIISFDDFHRVICDPEAIPRRSPVAIKAPKGMLWVSWKVIRRETTPDGNELVWGYIQAEEHADDAHNERINDLNKISRSLLSLLHTEHVEDAVNKILADMLKMFNGERAYIVDFDWIARTHDCLYEMTADNISSERDYVSRVSMAETPWWTEQIAQGRPVIINDLDELPKEAFREREILVAQDIRSLMVMPLVARDRIRGYVGIDLVQQRHRWSTEDYQTFSALVNIIGLCLELQRSEREAQADRNYLSDLYRHMPLGYVRMGLLYDKHGKAYDYKVLDSNLAADKIIGLEREKYVGSLATELGIQPELYLQRMLEVLKTGEYREYDNAVTPAKRSLHSILYSTCKDEVISLLSDTTDLRLAHESLDRNEKLLRNIFENIQVGVEIYDNNGKLIDLNIKDMEIFGVKDKNDVLGIDFYQNPNVPVEIREAVREGRDQAFRLNYPFDKVNGAYYESAKTGYLEIFTTVNMLYDMQGERANFMLINIDNTEINRAHSRIAEFESSFSLVSRFGTVGYCRYDLVSGEGYAVPQWYINLGEKPETPLSQIIGTYPHLDPEDSRHGQESLDRLLVGEIDNFSLDMRVLPDEGGEFWTRANVMRNPLNTDPSRVEVVSVNYDITELKNTERNLIEAKNKAEVSDRLKSAFLANMSHEIRTPLNAIVGFSNLLSETDDPKERQMYKRIVEENNELLLKLISDILDLSKIEAGTFDFNYGTVNVNQMCEETVRSLSLKVQDKSVEMRFGRHDDQCFIYGDKNRLMQVITNFINNAVKFTSEGHITLSYSIENGFIYFYVEDSGKGIPLEQQSHIFERFVKLNSFAQGTGLGLSICKSIVEQMHGHIGVESQPEAGSRFWFSVPVGAPPQIDSPDQELLPGAPEQRHRVVVAEDTDNNFLLISLTLRKDYDIIRARDGAEAVALCREQKPYAVLMDLKMPVMDGIEATRRIRAIYPTLPIIAITTFDSDRDRQRALEAGCSDYMAKPLSGERLRQRLRQLNRQK